MNKLKTTLDRFGVAFIEKVSNYINPVVLKFKNEHKQLLVFCFHGLFESHEQKSLNHIDPQNNMTTEQFVEFIEYFLSHNYKFIRPKDLISGLEHEQPYAMITFDDGYYNNMHALEILNKYKIPAVVFVSTKNVVENKAYWWDIIYKYRVRQNNAIEKIRREQEWLKNFKYCFIDDYILKNFGIKSFAPWSEIDRPFSKDEIKQLAKNPYIGIGNHTHNHSILTHYNEKEMKEELRVSNKILFELTNTAPLSIAFPNGNYNKMILQMTREEGFQYAFTTEPGRNLFPIENNKLTCLNRYMANTSNISRFGSFCRLGYDPRDLYEDLKIKTMVLLRLKSKPLYSILLLQSVLWPFCD